MTSGTQKRKQKEYTKSDVSMRQLLLLSVAVSHHKMNPCPQAASMVLSSASSSSIILKQIHEVKTLWNVSSVCRIGTVHANWILLGGKLAGNIVPSI